MLMENFNSLQTEEQERRLAALASKALACWNIKDAELALIKYRENAVYKVSDRSSKVCYALRVHRYGYHNDDELLSELAWMETINESGISTPEVIPGSDGELVQVVSFDGVPEPRQCDLLDWVEGEALGTIEDHRESDRESLVADFRTVGQLAAKLHNHSEQNGPPVGFTRHAWDEEGCCGDDPFWGRYWELAALTHEQRELLLTAAKQLRHDLIEFGKGRDRYGLIHADFAPENILVAGDKIHLIDFDDCGYGWYLFDLATPLFWHLGEDHFDAVFESIVAGYREGRGLPDEQVEKMGAFLLARGYTYLGWLLTRQETETARELAGPVIAGVCALAEEYLKG